MSKLSKHTQWVRSLRPASGWNGNGMNLIAWALLLAGLQAWGRTTRSDWAELFALAVFAGGCAGTWFWHRRDSLSWVEWLIETVHKVQVRWTRSRPNFGIDFRREPAVPFAVPKQFLVIPVVGLICLAAAWLVKPDGIARLRGWGVGGPYLGYLLLVGALWSMTLLLTCASASFVFAQLHEWFVRRRQAGKDVGQVLELRAQAILAADLFLCMLFVPVAWAMGLLAVSGFVCFVLWAWPEPEPQLRLWHNARRELRCLPGRWRYFLGALGPYLMVWALVLFLRGEPFGVFSRSGHTPFSEFLAVPLAWISAAAGCALAIRLVVQMRWRLRFHPARRTVPTIHLRGLLTEEQVRVTRRALARQGWALARSAKPRAEHVHVQLKSESIDDFGMEWFSDLEIAGDRNSNFVPRSEASTTDRPTWPLGITLTELTGGERRVMLMRRWQLQRRRILLRGLRKLFKAASSIKFARGDGMWIGIQHSFILGLIRDQDEEDEVDIMLPPESAIIGKPYHQIFPAVVREYYHELARALQFDLIFVADGVRFPSVRSVFRILFEVHDVFGGTEAIQEHHFAACHNARVLIQDVDGDPTGQTGSFGECGYSEMGRARILLILPNRGGETTRSHAPQTGGRVPVLH